MADPLYNGPWPAGSLVATSPQGATVATWGGAAWQLAGGGSAPAGGLSRTLGYTPTVRGTGPLAGVYWDTSTGTYRRSAVAAGGTAATSLSTIIPSEYGGGQTGIGGTIGQAAGGVAGGVLGGPQTGQALGEVGNTVGQGVQAGVVAVANLFS